MKAFKFVLVNELLVSKALFNSAKSLKLVVYDSCKVKVFIIFISTLFPSLANLIVLFKNLNLSLILLLKPL